MSIEFIRKVWRLPASVGSVKRLVLLAIADNANDEGYAWPSQQTLASKTGLSVRSVQVHIAELVQEGWLSIARVPRRAGRWSRNAYQMQLDRAQEPAPGDRAQDVRLDQAQKTAPPCAPRAHGPCARGAHEPSVVEPSVVEPSEEEPAPLSTKVLQEVMAAIDECLGQVAAVPRRDFDNLRKAIEERDGWYLVALEVCRARRGQLARWWTLKDEIDRAWEAMQNDPAEVARRHIMSLEVLHDET